MTEELLKEEKQTIAEEMEELQSVIKVKEPQGYEQNSIYRTNISQGLYCVISYPFTDNTLK